MNRASAVRYERCNREEYVENRKIGDSVQARMHRGDDKYNDREIHHIHPIWLGGSPDDPNNMIAITPEQHAEIERFWTTIRANLREQWHKE